MIFDRSAVSLTPLLYLLETLIAMDTFFLPRNSASPFALSNVAIIIFSWIIINLLWVPLLSWDKISCDAILVTSWYGWCLSLSYELDHHRHHNYSLIPSFCDWFRVLFGKSCPFEIELLETDLLKQSIYTSSQIDCLVCPIQLELANLSYWKL